MSRIRFQNSSWTLCAHPTPPPTLCPSGCLETPRNMNNLPTYVRSGAIFWKLLKDVEGGWDIFKFVLDLGMTLTCCQNSMAMKRTFTVAYRQKWTHRDTHAQRLIFNVHSMSPAAPTNKQYFYHWNFMSKKDLIKITKQRGLLWIFVFNEGVQNFRKVG